MIEFTTKREKRLAQALLGACGPDGEVYPDDVSLAMDVVKMPVFDELAGEANSGLNTLKPYKALPTADPNPVVGNCTKCGIDLNQTMMYVCSDAECPTFPRVTC